MPRIRHLSAAAMILVLAAVPAFGDHGGIHPTFRSENVYFKCTGPTKVQQANWIPAILEGGSGANRWDTNEPAQSVQDGGGCGGVDWGGTTNVVYSVAFQGTVKGNLRDLTVRIHQFVTHHARDGETETLRIAADIDGVPIFPPGAQPNHGRTVEVTPTLVNSGATEVYEFSITNLGFAENVLDAEGNVVGVNTGGAVKEDGDGSRERTLTIFLGLHGTALGQDPAGHKAATWVWDTTEVPSGITFNPSTLAAARVAADLPALDW